MTQIEAKQQELIKELYKEIIHLHKEIKDKDEDIAFLKRVVIASFEKVPNHKVVLFTDTPNEADFVLEENESGDLIIALKGRKSYGYNCNQF